MPKALALFVALFVSLPAVAGQPQKCVLPNGKGVYQDFDCGTERSVPQSQYQYQMTKPRARPAPVDECQALAGSARDKCIREKPCAPFEPGSERFNSCVVALDKQDAHIKEMAALAKREVDECPTRPEPTIGMSLKLSEKTRWGHSSGGLPSVTTARGTTQTLTYADGRGALTFRDGHLAMITGYSYCGH